ncbi:MAG: ABC transporter ATP-binding protein, partial [Candidatus Hydrogenedentales bacterium]
VVGLLFQDADAQLFSPTVFDDVAFGPLNLGLSPEETRARVRETLAELKLGTYEDRVTYRLSQGEKRLVGLATLLAMRPAVLLLDEPTAGLDPRHETLLTNILCSRPEAMLIISHNHAFMDRVATRQLSMADGRILPADVPQPEPSLHDSPLT